METKGHREDLKLARETCDELRAGNNEAILGVYQTYHPFFLGYTRRRLQTADDARAATIVDDFWVELLNAKAICSYEGLASLKTYLFGILRLRILDALRKKSSQKAYGNNVSDRGREIDELGSDEDTPEKDLLHREKIKLVHESLMVLSESSPKDAPLVKMHLEGLNYRQMAEKELGTKACKPKDLDKRASTIKKQFTRSKTGSLAKLKSCLERCMTKNKLASADLLN